MLYDYEIQISTSDKMADWIFELIGTSFHCEYHHVTERTATERIDNLKVVGFEIDYIKRKPYHNYEDIT